MFHGAARYRHVRSPPIAMSDRLTSRNADVSAELRRNSPPARAPATPSHDAPVLNASSSRRISSSEMSAGQPDAAATAASRTARARPRPLRPGVVEVRQRVLLESLRRVLVAQHGSLRVAGDWTRPPARPIQADSVSGRAAPQPLSFQDFCRHRPRSHVPGGEGFRLRASIGCSVRFPPSSVKPFEVVPLFRTTA